MTKAPVDQNGWLGFFTLTVEVGVKSRSIYGGQQTLLR
jgi:hypothetical protein